MVFIADIPVACAAGMASLMEADFRGFLAPSALSYGFLSMAVADGHRNSEGLRRAQNIYSLRSYGNLSWERGGTMRTLCVEAGGRGRPPPRGSVAQLELVFDEGVVDATSPSPIPPAKQFPPGLCPGAALPPKK